MGVAYFQWVWPGYEASLKSVKADSCQYHSMFYYFSRSKLHTNPVMTGRVTVYLGDNAFTGYLIKHGKIQYTYRFNVVCT